MLKIPAITLNTFPEPLSNIPYNILLKSRPTYLLKLFSMLRKTLKFK